MSLLAVWWEFTDHRWIPSERDRNADLRWFLYGKPEEDSQQAITFRWFGTLQSSSDTIMSTMASQITGVSIVCSTVCFKRRSKKTSKFRVTGLCDGNPLVTDGFPSQRASNAENVSIWWRHNVHCNSESRWHICVSSKCIIICQAMAYCLLGTKPLPERMLNYRLRSKLK